MFKVTPGRNDKGPNAAMSLAQQIQDGLQFFLGKSSKMVEVVKVIPTVAGVPWKANVHGTMVASAMLNVQGDIQKFMMRKPLVIGGDLTTR